MVTMHYEDVVNPTIECKGKFPGVDGALAVEQEGRRPIIFQGKEITPEQLGAIVFALNEMKIRGLKSPV